MMRDKIVFTATGYPQELLLREDKLTLDRAIQICRAYEHSAMHRKELYENITAPIKVNKLFADKKQKHFQNLKQHRNRRIRIIQDMVARKKECNFCDYKCECGKSNCPTCDKCNGRNHFRSK
jgi:hypothetical protein